MPEWDADVVIDEALVRALLEEQFPALAVSSARLLGEGWDNAVWVVDDSWAFRFPRREIAIPGVWRELEILPRLAPLVPVPIPEPRFVGAPGERFPWPFFGAPLLPGREAVDAALDGAARIELGADLGRLLGLLHGPDLRDRVDPDRRLPVDFNRRADMVKRVPMAQQFLADIGWGDRGASALFDRAAELGSPSETVFLHGDLHLRHVLVDHGVLSGIIDWGDACLGDPSVDLQIAWSLLDRAGRERFFEEYGPIGEERAVRARVLSVSLCAMLAKYARSVGYANLEREALAGVERALFD